MGYGLWAMGDEARGGAERLEKAPSPAGRNLIKSIITLLPAHHKVLRNQLPPLAFASLR